MIETTLSKVGNSMAVLLPKTLRIQAAFEPGVPLAVESPRKGVVVITAKVESDEDRLERLTGAEARIQARKAQVEPWPEGHSADELLKAGKDSRTHELFSI